MIARTDIYGILDNLDPEAAVSVVKNPQRFEWCSLMVFNNALCKKLTPEFIEKDEPFALEWADKVGALSPEWNHLVGYDAPRPDAKIVHFTMGIPCFSEVADLEPQYVEEWNEEFKSMATTCSWTDIMGNSRHAQKLAKMRAA